MQRESSRASEMYESRTGARLVHVKENRCLSHTLSLSLAHSLARSLLRALLLSLSLSRSAPLQKRAAPSGYVPGSQTVSRNADAGYTGVSSQSQVMTLATAKKWQPYLGYEPKRDRSTPAPAAPLSSAPSATAQMSSGTLLERKMYAEREGEGEVYRVRESGGRREAEREMYAERERDVC